MSKTVTESIYSGRSVIVPLADVQHIEILPAGGLWAITKHTKYNFERDTWENPVFIPDSEIDAFMATWSTYRHELEIDTLADIRPEAV